MALLHLDFGLKLTACSSIRPAQTAATCQPERAHVAMMPNEVHANTLSIPSSRYRELLVRAIEPDVHVHLTTCSACCLERPRTLG